MATIRADRRGRGILASGIHIPDPHKGLKAEDFKANTEATIYTRTLKPPYIHEP